MGSTAYASMISIASVLFGETMMLMMLRLRIITGEW